MPAFIVTFKLPRNPNHDPRNKVEGTCPVTGEHCTDVTGEHHSALVIDDSLDELKGKLIGGTHVTRIEAV